MVVDLAYTHKYIGSTTVGLSSRMAQHRRNYLNYKDGLYHFVSIYDLFDKYGLENCKIELVEEAPCETKEQLRKIEGQHIRNEECINKRIEGRSTKEWYDENKDRISENKKQYYKDNIDKIKARKKAHYEAHREENNAISRAYRANHRETLIEQCRKYYNDNREKLLEQKKEYVKNNYDRIRAKVSCPYCNNQVCKDKLVRHQKSNYCQELQNMSKN